MTPNQERVLHGLNSCGFYDGIPNICEVTECPYRDDKCGCVHELAHDAGLLISELMKAQEPRVVKMSELTAGEPMLVWLEDIDKEETVAGMIFDYVPGRLGFKLTDLASMDRIYPRIEDYLTRWRCWTSRPTDEQREAVKWE